MLPIHWSFCLVFFERGDIISFCVPLFFFWSFNWAIGKRNKAVKEGYGLYNISLHLVAGRKRRKENRGSGLSASLESQRVYLWCQTEREKAKERPQEEITALTPSTGCEYALSARALIRVICNLKVTEKGRKKEEHKTIFD